MSDSTWLDDIEARLAAAASQHRSVLYGDDLRRLLRVARAVGPLLEALDARDDASNATAQQSVMHHEHLALYAAEKRLEEAAQTARAALRGEETR